MKQFVICAMALFMTLPACAEMTTEDRVVTVSGRGEVTVPPDEAEITLTVVARDETQKAAQTEVDRSVVAVMRLLDDLDIPKKEINTTRINISPEYRWDKQHNENRIHGYMVQRSIVVRLTALEKLGELMQRATASGVNQVSPPILGAADEDEHRREALALAAEDARNNATVLARTLDAKVGPVRRITSSDVAHQPPPRPMANRAMMAESSAAAAESYTPGEIRFSASVTVEFDLDVR
ncbi:MAG: SIMPL domain-containing protein [Gammaproteobacteria bacterium]|nr:SIMPL domain-containing protein [Gammaproteobacteria bacterium]NND60501.1 SIMPL domain-containing protein [Gammaproteobacteria bacterium]